jgi:hypothetical protein
MPEKRDQPGRLQETARFAHHYVDDHADGRNQTEFARRLQERGMGSAAALSAWLNADRPPKTVGQLKALRDIAGCVHHDFDDESIDKMWSRQPGPSPADGAAGPLPTSDTSGRYPNHRRTVVAITACAALAVAAATVLLLRPTSPAYRVQVQSNPDEFVPDPALRDAAGSYAIRLPIGRIPAPPGGRNSCFGRYSWAHDTVGAIDAESTLFKVTITALGNPIVLNEATAVLDTDEDAVAGDTVLGCPGRGGPTPTHMLLLNLDERGKPTFYLDGDDTPDDLNVTIRPGQPETIVVAGQALTRHAKWRLQLALAAGGPARFVSIGPDGALDGRASEHANQRTFETVGPIEGNVYHFVNNQWTVVR